VTFSVLLHDPVTGETGAAVASKFLAVGALVLHARADSGAVATQALVKVSFGPDGLGLLRDGVPADEVVARLVAGDPSPDRRQLAVLGLDGRAAAYTGAGCMATAQHSTGAGFAALGNVLAGPEVVDALAAALGAHAPGTPVARTVLAALRAGEKAGGDRRGRQSAAVLVVRAGGGYGGSTDRVIDLRVDDHADPVRELGRLLDLHAELFDRPDEADLMPLSGKLRSEVAALLATVAEKPFDAGDDDGLWAALDAWAGRENLEERLVRPMTVDPVLVAVLRRCADETGAASGRPAAPGTAR
jgi:uncharacterized Ntn-hydrolase superfamily protein